MWLVTTSLHFIHFHIHLGPFSQYCSWYFCCFWFFFSSRTFQLSLEWWPWSMWQKQLQSSPHTNLSLRWLIAILIAILIAPCCRGSVGRQHGAKLMYDPLTTAQCWAVDLSPLCPSFLSCAIGYWVSLSASSLFDGFILWGTGSGKS